MDLNESQIRAMPKLYGIDYGQKFGYTIDKCDNEVAFSDEKHIYFRLSDGAKYTSVTTLLSNYYQPFDEFFWSSYKALEWFLGEDFSSVKKILLQTKRWDDKDLSKYNISVEDFNNKRNEILTSYKENRNKATSRGIAIHSKFEELFYQHNNDVIQKYTSGGKFDCKKGYYKLDLERAVYPEFLIHCDFDDYLRVSGTIDILCKDGNDLILGDFKTNKKIDFESYFDQSTKKRQMMKAPLNHLMDCSSVHYQLQLSLYAYMLQHINPKFNIKKLVIIHIDHDNNITEYEVEYLKEDVARMLLHYRKQQKIKSELAKDKPIVF